MHSADPPYRIATTELALLKNGFCDLTGQIVKSKGVSAVTFADAWGILATDGRVTCRSLHLYEGRSGQNPDSRLLAVVGSGLVRSKANDLKSRWDDIAFPSEMTAPGLDIAAAGAFRNEYFYHQNGSDVPFRVKCEETDPAATLTLTAEVLGLRPPLYFAELVGFTTGQSRRFPPNMKTSYALTFVYGDRGESGPGPVMTYDSTGDAAHDINSFNNIPLGPTGCTARRIYRSFIGQGIPGGVGGGTVVNRQRDGTAAQMFLVATINDNTTTTWLDQFDDGQLDELRRMPQPRPFPPVARYQIMHLDRLFWAKLRDHPWILGVMADLSRNPGANFEDYRVTISNTGNGTITFEGKDATTHAWSTDFTVANYKTLSLATILSDMMSSLTTGIYIGAYTAGVAALQAAGVDTNRTYTFAEISQRSIFGGANAYWFVAIDDTATEGRRWYPNRFQWSDITFPEQVSQLNSDDLTRFGSKRITGLVLLDNTPIVMTDTDMWLIPGDFVPDSFGVPNFEVHRSQASHGSICTRPDATTSIPNVGLMVVADDALRNFRGESSDLAGTPIRDWFARVLREPVARDFVTMAYFAGELFIALPTDEVET